VARYSIEHREWVVRQMMPPLNRTVPELAEETGITDDPVCLAQTGQSSGSVVPGDGRAGRPVVEPGQVPGGAGSASLMRGGAGGVLPAQGPVCRADPAVARGLRAGQRLARSRPGANAGGVKAAKKRIKQLERELRRKDAALAEAAALLVLRKKAEALWGEGRGRLISAPDRRETLQLIEEAVAAGARRAQACEEAGPELRTCSAGSTARRIGVPRQCGLRRRTS
jgi:hypothetical protein